MFNDLFNGVAGLAFLVLAVLVFWKYSQIWAVSVATKIIQIYFARREPRHQRLRLVNAWARRGFLSSSGQ
jgi:hypothetical protein